MNGVIKFRPYLPVLITALGAVGLYLISRYNYLLFHSLAELFSIVVAGCIFIIAWNARHLLDNAYLLFIGIASLFIGGIDLVHTLAYKGMGVFPRYDANLPTQLWIAARYLQAVTLLVAPWFLRRKGRSAWWVVAGFSLVTALLLASIFGGVFPDCYIEGSGLTPFKKASEYVISGILVLALGLLLRVREALALPVRRFLGGAILATIGSELAFTFYVSVYGFSNLVGHLLKILAFYLIYRALIETGFRKPYQLLFRELKQHETLLRQERDRAQSYLDIAGVMLVVVDADQTVQLINQRGCEILGCEEGSILGKNWFDTFIPERDREGRLRDFLQLMAGAVEPSRYLETIVCTAEGGERLIAWHNSLLTDAAGNTIGTLSSGQDVTEQRKLEEEREQALEELARSNQELEHFAHIVSHDLQEPLRMVTSFLDLLARRYQDRLDADADEFIGYAVDGANRMQTLIRDLLTYARVGTRGEPLKPTDSKAVVDRILSYLQLTIQETAATVTYAALPTVMADETQLGQVFQNLIGNALKFRGTEPPRIEISARRQGDMWAFSVRDNGIGIDPRQAERIFQIFQRLHTREEYPGTGIGLALCKKIVERHGGQIWVESQPGQGATFRFTLPAVDEYSVA